MNMFKYQGNFGFFIKTFHVLKVVCTKSGVINIKENLDSYKMFHAKIGCVLKVVCTKSGVY